MPNNMKYFCNDCHYRFIEPTLDEKESEDARNEGYHVTANPKCPNCNRYNTRRVEE